MSDGRSRHGISQQSLARGRRRLVIDIGLPIALLAIGIGLLMWRRVDTGVAYGVVALGAIWTASPFLPVGKLSPSGIGLGDGLLVFKKYTIPALVNFGCE